MEFLNDLHGKYGAPLGPAFFTHVWGEMMYEYNIVVAESTRRILQALHRAALRDRLEEKAPRPLKGGATLWKFPTAFQTKRIMGFWKSIALPRLGRRVERDMLNIAIPFNQCGKRAGGLAGDELLAKKRPP